VTCPFCDSPQVERVAQWGGQIITAQWRCAACNSYFEAVREDYDDTPASVPPTISPQATNRPEAA
jgi:transposase-like protein